MTKRTKVKKRWRTVSLDELAELFPSNGDGVCEVSIHFPVVVDDDEPVRA